MTAVLCPTRLSSRALDGFFAPAELPGLLARAMLLEATGKLVVEQADGARLFAWSVGRLAASDGTAPGEGLVPFVAQAAGEQAFSRLQQRVLRNRRTDQPLATALRAPGVLEPTLAAVAEQAQARQLMLATLTRGDAVAWFEPGPVDAATSTIDGFGALWQAVSEAYDGTELLALGRAVQGRTAASELGVTLIRQLAVDPAVTRLTVSAHAVSDDDLRWLGALVLCGLVGFAGDPVPAPQPRPSASYGAEVDEVFSALPTR